MKQWLIIGGIALVLIISYLWNRNRSINGDGEDIPPVEEVIVQEDGSMVRRSGENVEVLSPEEAESRRQEIEEKVAGADEVQLNPLEGMRGQGTTARVVEGSQYYQRVSVANLAPLDKGYFYQAWLEDDQGNRVSLGRLEMQGGSGQLFYSVNEDKSRYSTIVVSREVEDGNEAIGEIVLRGSFTQASNDNQE